MLGQGYDRHLALGTVAASGTLGILIPPSIMLVIMADQLSLSVGDLFMGAVMPGLILGGLYILYIVIIGLIKPQAAPLSATRRDLSREVLWDVLKTIAPPFGLIVLVLGSIFTGIATPTEASGVGAIGACLLVWKNKTLSFQVFKEVNILTFKTCGHIFGIFFGAQAFALVLRMLGGDDFIERILTGLPFGPHGTIGVILFMIFLMGFFLDWIEISLIFLPLLSPVVATLGLEINGHGLIENPELVWFTVLVAVTLQTSFLTPPVGFTLFFLQGVAPKGVTLADIYKGIIPFVILQLIGLALVLFWPQLVLWLPALVYR
jgi:tripartite ATP-independent transporter DctM subunit